MEIKSTSKHKNYIISFESIKFIHELEYLILDEYVSIIQHCNSTLTMDKHNKDDNTDESPLLYERRYYRRNEINY